MLVVLEVEDTVAVENVDEDTIEDEKAVEDEVAVVDATVELVDALPERVPEMTLLPELEGEPSEDLSQQVPEPTPLTPPT